MKRNPNPTTIRIYKRRLAIKVRTYRQAKTTSWREYISKLKAKTPTSLIWQKIRKISGKHIPKPHPNLKIGHNLIASPREVAGYFVEYYASISNKKDKYILPPDLTHNDHQDEYSINLDFTMR